MLKSYNGSYVTAFEKSLVSFLCFEERLFSGLVICLSGPPLWCIRYFRANFPKHFNDFCYREKVGFFFFLHSPSIKIIVFLLSLEECKRLRKKSKNHGIVKWRNFYGSARKKFPPSVHILDHFLKMTFKWQSHGTVFAGVAMHDGAKLCIIIYVADGT